MNQPTDNARRASRNGTYVLAFVGIMMLMLLARAAETGFDIVMLGAIGVGLVWGSVRLARFIREHGDEIGEARFDTRNKD